MYRMYLTAGALSLLAAVVAFGQDSARPKDKKKFEPARLLKEFDANGDGVLERSELPERMKERFAQLDQNGDGKVDRDELAKMAQRPDTGPRGDSLFMLLDANGDGKLSQDELQNAAKALARFDRNKDGVIDGDELYGRQRKFLGRPGEIITPAAKAERIPDKLQVGDPAPNFKLPLVNGKGAVALADFKDRKPVVLIFASYT